MGAFSFSLGFQWTPPGAPANSGNSSLVVTGTENGQNVGRIDVAALEASGTEHIVPLGSVDDLKAIILQNSLAADIAVHLNGAVAATFELSPGQIFVIAGNSAPATVPITSVSFKTTAIAPASVSYVNYWTCGD